VATWWRVQRGDLAKDAMIGFVVGVVLFLGACWWDARLQARQDALASAIADRQDDLARDLANQAEVLENTRFVRQAATSTGTAAKPFASINLHGGQLAGLELLCTGGHRVGCADFSGADLREANLAGTLLPGGHLGHADLRGATLDGVDFSHASLDGANLDRVVSTPDPNARGPRFHRAELDHATLVEARLAKADMGGVRFSEGNADRAVLSSANFRNAYLVGSRFQHADLRDSQFEGAEMWDLDLTSADLRGADLSRADLRRAVVTDLCFDKTTKWGSNSPPTSSSC